MTALRRYAWPGDVGRVYQPPLAGLDAEGKRSPGIPKPFGVFRDLQRREA